MARSKFTSPKLVLKITEERYGKAEASNSGGCVIADAIKEQYPHLTHVVVDMATIRVSDRKAGKRYTYLTPDQGQYLLLAIDQGWSKPSFIDEVLVRGAVKITPTVRTKSGPKSTTTIIERRQQRKEELEAKIAAGITLTRGEKTALTQVSKPYTPSERPTSTGPVEVGETGFQGKAVVHGGQPLPQGKPHPNLLRGRDRHFGAKMADPGKAFQEAVDQAVAERLAEQSQ